MKHLLIIAYLTIWSNWAVNAQVNIDSLTAVIQQTKNDTIRGKLFIRLSTAYFYTGNFTKMINAAENASAIGRQLKQNAIVADAHNNIGLAQQNQGNYKEAIANHILALSSYQSMGDSLKVLGSYNNLGTVSLYLANLDNALKYYLSALRIAEADGGKRNLGLINNNIGLIYYKLSNYDQSLPFLEKALQFKKALNDRVGMASTLHNLGELWEGKKNPDRAKAFFEEALAINEKIGNQKRIGMNLGALAGLSITQGEMKYEKRDTTAAIQIFNQGLMLQDKALTFLQTAGDKSNTASGLVRKAILQFYLKIYAAADTSFEKGIALATQLGNKDYVRDAHLSWANLKQKLAEDPTASAETKAMLYKNAFFDYKNGIRFKDSITNEKTLQQIAEINTKYQTEIMQNEIKQLHVNNLLQKTTLKQREASLALNRLINDKQKLELVLLNEKEEIQNIKIKSAEEILEKKNLAIQLNMNELALSKNEKKIQIQALEKQTLLKNYLLLAIVLLLIIGALIYNRTVLQKKLETQQKIYAERQRIIADLHDDIGATLSSLHLYGDMANQIWDAKPQASKEMLGKITIQSKELMNRMGDIIWSMKPSAEDKNTFSVRLKNYSNELLAVKNISCNFDIDVTLDEKIKQPDIRKNLLLITKEAMNNIAKYSEATRANIQFIKQADYCLLKITDNGKGFDQLTIKPGNGLGNIEFRCKQLSGKCNILSTIGLGTCIECIFPIAIISYTK